VCLDTRSLTEQGCRDARSNRSSHRRRAVLNLVIQLSRDECGNIYAVDGRFCLSVCSVRARACAGSHVRQTEFATVQESATFSAITLEYFALTQTLLMSFQAQSALALALESTFLMTSRIIWRIEKAYCDVHKRLFALYCSGKARKEGKNEAINSGKLSMNHNVLESPSFSA
jgi:hypothetical protein